MLFGHIYQSDIPCNRFSNLRFFFYSGSMKIIRYVRHDFYLTNSPHGGFYYQQSTLLMIAKSDSVSCMGCCPNPSFKMFIAALRSRSCSTPHFGHFHCRTFKSFTCRFFSPQQWHSWLDAKNLSTSTINVPNLFASYFNILTKSLNAKSEIFLLQSLCIAFTFKSSMHIVSYSMQSFRASLKWKSCLWFAAFLWSRARCNRARRRLFEPFRFLENSRNALAISFAFCAKNSGLVTSFPSDAVKNFFNPKSKPTP